MVVEKLITRAKRAVAKEGEGKPKDVHARREVFAFLRDREAVTTLFNEIAPKVATRAGGYTRVVKLGRRLGDGGEVSIVELVDYNTGQEKAAPKPKAKAAAARKRGPKKGKPETTKKAEGTTAEDETAETPAKAEESKPEAAESSSN